VRASYKTTDNPFSTRPHGYFPGSSGRMPGSICAADNDNREEPYWAGEGMPLRSLGAAIADEGASGPRCAHCGEVTLSYHIAELHDGKVVHVHPKCLTALRAGWNNWHAQTTSDASVATSLAGAETSIAASPIAARADNDDTHRPLCNDKPNGHDAYKLDWAHAQHFVYCDESGAPIQRNVRVPKLNLDGTPLIGAKGKQAKFFFWEHLNGSGKWEKCRDCKHAKIPYRLPEMISVLQMDRTVEVFVVEGERKADVLRSWGLTATSIPDGTQNFGHHFADANVVILPDRDGTGRRRCDSAAREISQHTPASLRVLELPGLGDGEDVEDWKERGGTREQLLKLVDPAAVDWVDSEPEAEPVRRAKRTTNDTDAHRSHLADDKRTSAYLQKALDDECSRVANAKRGERNHVLNRAAFSLGQLIDAGLDEQEMRDRMYQAAKASGLATDDGRSQVLKTISSGITAGKKEPRDIPESDARAYSRGENDPPPWTEHPDEPGTATGGSGEDGDAERSDDAESAETPSGESGNATGGDIPGEALAEAIRDAPRGGDATATTGNPLPFFDCGQFKDMPVPLREWFVKDRIPMGDVTILSGDGGTGKTLLALQLCVDGTREHGAWLNAVIDNPGNVMFVTAEEQRDEVHRRLRRILDHRKLDFDALAGKLHILTMPDEQELDRDGNVLLAVLDPKTGAIKPTTLYHRLLNDAVRMRPKLIVTETAADLFGGNEINRNHARAFVSLLRRIAMRSGAAVLLIMHPSVAGMSSGTGTSGSTGWNNSCRSRMYFHKPKMSKDDDGGEEIDKDLRQLDVMKSNYGPPGETVRVRWKDGVFVPDRMTTSDIERTSADLKAEQAFLGCLDARNESERWVGWSKGANFAPFVFAKMPEAKGVGKHALEKAMERLFTARKIRLSTYRRSGHDAHKIVRNDDLSAPDGKQEETRTAETPLEDEPPF
jgi:RecA-family ATPase